jgi:HEPN domain-containing protein
MATRPDQSAALAAKQAKLPEVVRLFEQLAGRAETLARMQDEFLESIIRNREARTNKPFRNTKRQQRFLDEFDKDAEQAVRDMERLTAKMDDRSLLISALSGEHQQLQLDEGMASSYRPEDKEMAERLIEFRRETIRLIEQFVETSPFRGQVISIWHAQKKTNAV